MKNQKKIFAFIFSICLVAMGFSFGYCEDLAEEVTLYVGQVKTFPADMPSRIVIGNPEVADVTSASEKEIVVTAKSAGVTAFVFWDTYGEQDFRIRVFAEDMRETKQRVDEIVKELNLPKVYTKAVDSEGKVLLLGEVKTSGDRERISTALGTLQDKIVDLIQIREEALVEIDVQVLELTKEASFQLGFKWPTNIDFSEQNYPTSTTPKKWSTLFHVSHFSRDALTWTINLLEKERKLHILSRPRLVCLSGKEAELLVGGEMPTFTATVTEGGTTTGEVAYKEYGIKLKIRPTVGEDNRIQLSLSTEVSELGTVETTTYARAYPLTKRSTTTELYLEDGQTVAIGGLIKQKADTTVQKVPILGDIPILKFFFRHKEFSSDATSPVDTELFITITPTIVAGKEASKEIAQEQTKPAVEVKSLETKALPLELQNYIKAIQTKIINTVYYPKEAKDASWQGILKLSLLINADGSLKDMTVVESSGYKILDDAGQEAVKKIAPFPSFPAQLNLKELRVEIPIVYHKD